MPRGFVSWLSYRRHEDLPVKKIKKVDNRDLPPINFVEVTSREFRLKDYPGWKEISSEGFDKRGEILEDIRWFLDGRWVLIDSRPKSAVKRDASGLNSVCYEDEIFEDAIFKVAGTRSRFGLSWIQLQGRSMMEALAAVLDVNPHAVRLPYALEFCVLWQLHYKTENTSTPRGWYRDTISDTLVFSGGYPRPRNILF